MKKLILLLIISCSSLTNTLECGTGRTGSEELKKALQYCVKNNETLKLILDTSSSESESAEYEDSDFNNTNSKIGRMKRSRFNLRNSEENQTTTTTTEENNATTTEAPIFFNENPGCMVHCILERLNMTDENGFPIVEKFTEGLLKTATNRELRDFIQDSVSECFLEVNEDGFGEACEYSSKLVLCLATKGKTNCADWPVSNLPI